MAQMSIKSGTAQNLYNINESHSGFKEQYCRLCLSSTNQQFRQLFSPFNTTQSIVEVVKEFAKVTILQEDEYSKLICSDCFIKLTENEKFKSLIENSDLKLRNRLVTCDDSIDFDSTDNNDVIDDDSDHEKVIVVETDIKTESNSGTEILKDCGESNSVKSNGVRKNKNRTSKQKEKDIEKIKIVDADLVEDLKLEEISTDVEKLDQLQKKPRKIFGNNDKVGNKWKRGRPKVEKKDKGNDDDDDDDDEVPLIKLKKKRIRKDYHLECPHCNMVFRRHDDRKRHLITHTGIYPVYCSFCNKGLTCKSALEAHLLTHTEKRNYQCELCGKSFKRPNTLVDHTKSHGNEKPFKCDQCYREFKSKHTLLMHIASIHSTDEKESKFVCEICKKSYATKNHLKIHSYFHKRQELDYCDICDKNVKHYANHLKIHTKPHKCSVCNQGFRSTAMLKAHVVVHTGERSYECDICKKSFRFHGSLYTHKKTHDSTKRPKCEVCGKQFIYKQQLKLHLEKTHPESN